MVWGSLIFNSVLGLFVVFFFFFHWSLMHIWEKTVTSRLAFLFYLFLTFFFIWETAILGDQLQWQLRACASCHTSPSTCSCREWAKLTPHACISKTLAERDPATSCTGNHSMCVLWFASFVWLSFEIKPCCI